MLDGVHASEKRLAHALGRLHVRHDGKPQLVGLGAGRAGDLKRHAYHAGLPRLGGVKDAAGDEELDDVGLAGKEVAHHGRGLLGHVGHLGKEPGAVPAGDGDARAGGNQARSLQAPGLYGVAHGEVAEERVSCAADGGDAAR